MSYLKSSIIALLLVVLSIFVVSTTVSAGENNIENLREKNEKSHEKSKRQNVIRGELEKNLKLEGLNKDKIKEEGSFYFTENDEIVLQLKKDFNNKDIHSKLEKTFKKLINSPNSNFKLQYVTYSQEELENLVKDWFDLNSEINFSENIIVRYDYLNNRVEIKTDKLSEINQNSLLKKYGNKIYLNVDPSHKLPISYSKAREADWTKLGAGLGIQVGFTACTTGGVVKKDSNYFLLTAGHCIPDIGSTVYQWNSKVGIAHAEGRARGYDFGLIRIEDSPFTRYAYNGLYTYDNNPSDYQGRLQHYDTPDNAETLCKSGITTGYTCGIVTSTAANIGGKYNFELTDTDYGAYGWLAGSGDSGSPGFRSANGYLIGIQSSIVRAYYDESDNVYYSSIAYFAPYKAAAASYGVSLYTSSTSTAIYN